MITEQSLRDYPALVRALTGITADQLWELVQQMAECLALPASESEAARARPVGRPCAHPLAVRVAAVLTYLRVHIPQTVVGLLFAVGQEDISRDLRRLLPAIQRQLPCPEVWDGPADPSAEPLPMLLLEQAAHPRAIIDATEQRVARPQDAQARQVCYSGKTKHCTLKPQVVSTERHHIAAISVAVPGSVHDKRLCAALQTLARLPDECEVDADKGYQGLANQVPLMRVCDPLSDAVAHVPRLRVLTPLKKPKRQECRLTNSCTTVCWAASGCGSSTVSAG